jgi:hypothetical protein
VTLIAEKGAVDGETRNITAKGVYILFEHTTEEIALNETYRLLIKPPGEKIVVSDKLIWSNLDIMPRMGFCFLEFNEGDRELLLEAIQKFAGE